MTFDNIFGTGIILALLTLIVGMVNSHIDSNPREYHSYVACEGEPDLELYWD